MNQLTTKQKKFVKEYIKSLNPEKSAIFAGYNRKIANLTAENLLENPKILEYLDIQLSKKAQSLRIEKAYIIKKLLIVIETNLIQDNERAKDTSNGLKALDILCKQLDFKEFSQAEPENTPILSIIENLNDKKI